MLSYQMPSSLVEPLQIVFLLLRDHTIYYFGQNHELWSKLPRWVIHCKVIYYLIFFTVAWTGSISQKMVRWILVRRHVVGLLLKLWSCKCEGNAHAQCLTNYLTIKSKLFKVFYKLFYSMYDFWYFLYLLNVCVCVFE